MKYPGVPPAGSGPVGSGWQAAGCDLALAEIELLAASDVIGRVQLAEVLRRRFKIREALRALRDGDASGSGSALLLLCEGTIHWTACDRARAEASIGRALDVWRESGDHDGILAATIATARCTRLAYRRESRAVLTVIDELAAATDDVHLLADRDRERAAWALLAGEHADALEWSRRAAEVHHGVGDAFLVPNASVLRSSAVRPGAMSRRPCVVTTNVRCCWPPG